MTSDTDRPSPRSDAGWFAVISVLAVLALAMGIVALVSRPDGTGAAAASSGPAPARPWT